MDLTKFKLILGNWVSGAVKNDKTGTGGALIDSA